MNKIFTGFKNIFRLQKRRKGLNLISMIGIMLGYSCFFLTISYVWHERSYDRFFKNSDNIYRLVYSRYDKNTLQYATPNGFSPCGRYLKENVPGVVNYATIARNYNITVTTENAKGQPVFFNEEKTYFVSSSFLSIFSFPVIRGDIKSLDLPDKVFVTNRIVKKYFGSADPIGKVIRVNGGTYYTIAGILKDLPANTHLKFDFLFSLQTHINQLLKRFPIQNHWYGYDLFYTYLQLKDGTEPAVVEKALPVMVEKNYGDKLAAANQKDIFHIQPLTSIHLHSNLEWETEKPGNGDAVNILMYFSVFVLLITWINNINLISAQAADKAKEIGIRKVLGSSQPSLFLKLSIENAVINLFSICIAGILLFIISQFFASSAVFSIEAYSNFRFWLLILAAVLLGVVLTSVVPALSISRFNPVDVLKGKLAPTNQNIFFRNALIVFQFIISFILITGALIIYRQGIFLMEKNRGLDNSSVVAVKFPKILDPDADPKETAEVIKDEIQRLKWVKDYTIATDMPEREIETFGNMYRPIIGPQDIKAYFRIGADDNYFRFFKVRLIAGRFFSKDLTTDTAAFILNESAVKKFGFDNPAQVIGQQVKSGKKFRTIIGVVNDFHYRSVKVKPVATMFTHQENKVSYFAIKLYANDPAIETHLAELKKIYSSLYPGNPFEYFFLENEMKKDLETDLDFAHVFGVFSLMSILISLTGLLGLVMINLNQRVKELGVRKVLGASLNDIGLLVMEKFTAPIVIALLIGIPVSVWGFSKWISAYYIYHIPMNWYYFVIPAVFLPLTAIMVIAIQVLRVNNQKVTQSLYE